MQVFAGSISNSSNSNGTRSNAAIAAAIFTPPTPDPGARHLSCSSCLGAYRTPAHCFLQSVQSPKQKVKRKPNPKKVGYHTLPETKNQLL
ncbi:hypothetical protein [Parasitella parasitica]|uniref:Uncharacterized protein n=1 Tax=Parasitella parasitica TaxID=35722 RepID=A0A0B7NRL3_9FUNG|nr:hypothetical protein [Parasitella parasitica]